MKLFPPSFSSDKGSPRAKAAPAKRTSQPQTRAAPNNGSSLNEADSSNSSKQQPQQQQGKAAPDSKIEDWWAQFETSVWDQVLESFSSHH